MFSQLTMYQALEKACKSVPNTEVIYYRGTRIKYKNFLKRVDDMAAVMYYTLGIRENDVILVAQPNIPDTLVLLYELNKIGAVINFVHPFTPFNQIQSIIKKTKSKYAIMFEQRVAKEVEKYREISDMVYVTRVENDLPLFTKFIYHNFMNFNIRKKLGKARGFEGFKYLHELKKVNKTVETCPLKENKCTILLHSGSTTGEPKTICLSDQAFNYLANDIMSITGKTLEELDGSKMLNVLPSFHGFGLAMTMHCPVVCGMGIVMIPKFSAKEVTKNLNATHFKYACGVPTMYEKLFQYEGFSKSKYFAKMEACYCGGDALQEAERNRINDLFKAANSRCRLFEGYGLTEVIAVNCVNIHDHHKYGSIGWPIVGAEFKICDEEGNEVKRNELGEIVIKSSSIMLGYYKDEEATKACLKDGWLHTGDLGYMDDDGYIFFKSRIKRVVKVSGVAVFPSEVERLIESMPQVSKVAAIRIPDKKLQSAIKVFVKANYFDEEGMRREILETCKKYLIRWAVPKEIEFRDELPETKLGKVDYRSLQEEENAKSENN